MDPTAPIGSARNPHRPTSWGEVPDMMVDCDGECYSLVELYRKVKAAQEKAKEAAGRMAPGSDLAWTEEWPTEPGAYWFYGKTSRDGNLKMRQAQVHYANRTNRTNLVRIVDGLFIYESNGAKGFWLPLESPQPPEIPEGFFDQP